MLLPICIVLSVVALVLAVLLFLRDRRGRGVQWLGLAALPMGLYLSGLLTLLIDFARAIWQWVQQLALNPLVITGLSLIGLTVVLWIAGGWLARRRATRRAIEKTTGTATGNSSGRASTPAPFSASAVGRSASGAPAAPTATGSGRAPAGKSKQDIDPEMDEIEALLKQRGIE